MNEPSDAQLLRDYAREGSEAAFREIVARHTDFVYSCALRQARVSDDARDIAQSVFIALASKAGALSRKMPGDGSILGWLHRSARYEALNRWRAEQRRLEHERQAMEQLLGSAEPTLDWEVLRPALDAALDDLRDDDREALLLRYFKKQDLRAVGRALGVGEDAAQKRVSRALEGLRESLRRRGFAAGTGGLVAAITANAVQAAPVGLAAAISTAAAISGAAIGAGASVTAAKIITMTTLQKAISAAAMAAILATGVHQTVVAAQLRGQTQRLEERSASLASRLDELNRRRAEDEADLARGRYENERLKRNEAELKDLRAEMAAARAASIRKLPEDGDPQAKQRQAFLDRVKLLRQRVEQWPGRKMPEMQLLTEQDWLYEPVRHALDTESAQREAARWTRYKANEKFADAIQPALQQFAAANNGAFPSDLSQLVPYVKPPLDSFLDDFEIAPASAVRPNFSPNGADMQKVGSSTLVPKGLATNGYLFDSFDNFIVIYNGGHYYRTP